MIVGGKNLGPSSNSDNFVPRRTKTAEATDPIFVEETGGWVPGPFAYRGARKEGSLEIDPLRPRSNASLGEVWVHGIWLTNKPEHAKKAVESGGWGSGYTPADEAGVFRIDTSSIKKPFELWKEYSAEDLVRLGFNKYEVERVFRQRGLDITGDGLSGNVFLNELDALRPERDALRGEFESLRGAYSPKKALRTKSGTIHPHGKDPAKYAELAMNIENRIKEAEGREEVLEEIIADPDTRPAGKEVAVRLSWAASLQQTIGDPPDVSGWKAYYQVPQFYETWINSDTLPKRNQFSDILMNSGYTFNGKKIMVDGAGFIKTLSQPGDPNKLIDDLTRLLFRIDLSAASKAQVKQDILLSGQISDYYWTSAWNQYVSTPGYTANTTTVKNKVRDLLKYLMDLSEYQLA